MRVQLLLAARGGCTDALFARLDDEGHRAKKEAGDARVIGLTQIADDQFPLANPLCRPTTPVPRLTPSWRWGARVREPGRFGVGSGPPGGSPRACGVTG